MLGKDRIKHILLNILTDLLLGHILVMLGGKYNCLKTNRLSVLIILYRNLALAVRLK